MTTGESFRYSWIKVTDENARAAVLRSALDLQQQLAREARAAKPGSHEALFIKTQLNMVRWYLGEDMEHGTRIVIFPSPDDGSFTLDLLSPMPHTISNDGIEIGMATMPAGFAREDAIAWLDTPVGRTWSQGALAIRLSYAVVVADGGRRMVAPETRTETAEAPCSPNL